MDFWSAVSSCLRQYMTFSGRASRSEYWYFMLFVFISGLALAIMEFGIDTARGDDPLEYPLLVSWMEMILFLPILAVTIRRFHDTNRSGLWMIGLMVLNYVLMYLWLKTESAIPVIGMIAIVIMQLRWCCQKGTVGKNSFGEDPLASPPQKTSKLWS